MIVFGVALTTPWAMGDVWDELARYEMGDATNTAPAEVTELIGKTAPDDKGAIEERFIALLQSDAATPAAKWFACRMLQRVGTEACVPVLASLLHEEKLSHYARLTLERLTDSDAAGKALLKAVKEAPDQLKIGIIGSLGVRGDEGAVKTIAEYTKSENLALAKAAAEALGKIGGKPAAAELRKALADQAAQPVDADALLARAEAIKDPGTFYRRGESMGVTAMGEGCVTSEGKPGWKGEYFNGSGCDGEPVLVRHDESIQFNWDKGSPGEGIQADHFTVRWTGTVTPPESRLYTLFSDADDSISIAVDGAQLTNTPKGSFKREAQVGLEAGTAYTVVVTYGELAGHARITLDWDCPLPGQHEAKACALAAVVPVAQQGSLLASGDGLRPDDAYALMREGRNPGVRAGAFIQLASADPKRARSALVEMLKQVRGSDRAALLRAAMESGDTQARDVLIGGLKGAPPADQLVLLGAMRELKLKAYERDVIALLETPENKVRDAAIYTLAVIGGPASFKPLYGLYTKNPSEAVTYVITALPVPSVDAQLLKTVGEGDDMGARLSAMTPLVLRNPAGAIALLNRLAGAGHPDEIRKGAYKALESINDLETCRVLAAAVVKDDAWRKPAQLTLKRVCVYRNEPQAIWNGAFAPALESADNGGREALLAILDGVACNESLAYLKKAIETPGNPLRPAALRSLARWPHFNAGEAWVTVAAAEGSASEDVTAAERGIVRVLTRKEISAKADQRVKLAGKAIQKGPTPEFKQAILACYEKPSKDDRAAIKKHWKPLLNDANSNVVMRVEALMK